MGKDIPLGRIAGIKVGMDVTVFLFAGFLAFVLATMQLPRLSDGHSAAAYWIAAAAGALFFFLSLLVHEIGHALVARDEGIGVESMGLNLLGGVTRMESSPTTPGAEFRVSVVGPIASATCGVVFLIGSFFLPDRGLWDLAGGVFFWAGSINLLLAVLNMVPAAPLDGGKVLSSLIWRSSGSQATAMIWSGAAGIVVGMALVTWGWRTITRTDDVFGWFNVGVGLFIAWSAFQQIRTAPLFKALEGRTVGDAMAAGPPSAAEWSTVGEFLRTSSPRPEHQAYPVVATDGHVSGLLTASAIRAVPPETWDGLAVTALAHPLDRITVIRAEEPLIPAMQKVESGEVRHALVVAADGRIVGTLDPSALDRALHQAPAHRQPSPV